MEVNLAIVVSVIRGRKFPIRHGKNLIVEARFEDEVILLDPKPHVSSPSFATELAYGVSKKELQRHRLQKTPIKLLFYCIDLKAKTKEFVGYIYLDIGLAEANSPQWISLQNCKYQRKTPEVLIELFLEKIDSQSEMVTKKSHELESITQRKRRTLTGAEVHIVNNLRPSKQKPSVSSISKTIESKSINSTAVPSPVPKPTCNSTSTKCHQQSSSHQSELQEPSCDNFLFSIILTSAANLDKLAPPSSAQSSQGFYFYYSVFENAVTTGKFSSLSNPEFLVERASVQISTSTDLLAAYFNQQSSIELLLLCGDTPLASGYIPLSSFTAVTECKTKPLTGEFKVQIKPLEKKLHISDGDRAPFVTVSVVLKKEDF